jgi:hypothetical protein
VLNDPQQPMMFQVKILRALNQIIRLQGDDCRSLVPQIITILTGSYPKVALRSIILSCWLSLVESLSDSTLSFFRVEMYAILSKHYSCWTPVTSIFQKLLQTADRSSKFILYMVESDFPDIVVEDCSVNTSFWLNCLNHDSEFVVELGL